jgi:hypothetical protein
MLRKFLIERDVPGIGGKNPVDLGEAAKISNIALAKLSELVSTTVQSITSTRRPPGTECGGCTVPDATTD